MNLMTARNADQLLPIAVQRLILTGVERDTRNGKVLQIPGPSIMKYERPLERVVFWPERNANPFFHVIEAMWMLAGRNDVAGVKGYASNIENYSDDGRTFNGAYGYRWIHGFRFNQLKSIASSLKKNPDCRRQVLSMWDPELDAVGRNSRDLPCNTHAYFSRDEEGRLDMTVCNRSNDLVWGALGANAVHFSFLLEYMSAMIGCKAGSYYQFTNNLHGYFNTLDPIRSLATQTGISSRYEVERFEISPLLNDGESVKDLDEDLSSLGSGLEYKTSFFQGVVGPIENAWKVYKNNGPGAASICCSLIKSGDWRVSAEEWFERCAKKRREIKNEGAPL